MSGGTLVFMYATAMASVTTWISPIALIVHPNPMVGNNVRSMLGNMSPPVTLPHAVIAMASALLLEKYVEVTATVGANNSPFPMPTQTP